MIPIRITLDDKEKGSNLSAPQILTLPQFDSRTQQVFNSTTLTYTKIRTLRKDPTIQLARMAVAAPMLHTPWVYKEKKDAPKEAVEFVKRNLECIRDWFLQTAIYGALDFGWQPFETIFKPEDGQIWLDWLKPLLHDFTEILIYMDTGRFAGFVNEPTMVGSYEKDAIVLRPYAVNINFVVEGTDWYGESVFQNLETTLTQYDNVSKVADRYDRKIAGATWVVYYPVGFTEHNGVEKKNSEIAAAILASLEASGAVAIPDEIQEFMSDNIEKEMQGKWRVELLTADSTSQSSFIDRLKYLDTLKMRAFGLPERSILEGTHGTKAEAGEHTNIALATVQVKHVLLCDIVNYLLIQPLMTFNFGYKYRDAVTISPAPLVSSQFQTVKELYRMMIQAPETLVHEYSNIDTEQIRSDLGIPSLVTPKPIIQTGNNPSKAQGKDQIDGDVRNEE